MRRCLQVEVAARPTAEAILGSRFLKGRGGWGMDRLTLAVAAALLERLVSLICVFLPSRCGSRLRVIRVSLAL